MECELDGNTDENNERQKTPSASASSTNVNTVTAFKCSDWQKIRFASITKLVELLTNGQPNTVHLRKIVILTHHLTCSSK